ncbi:Uridylate kinase [bioreactor metagenome]|uniref:Uridylate kinase n=1 Tax=bioreactor metagenome TaxID=1076179 RepID=A0A645E4L1_9ZZZZ
METKYSRILIKLSGEALMGENDFGISSEAINNYADEIVEIHNNGVQVAIVVGGGNIYRGIQSNQTGITKISGDKMGMLATVMNAIALRDVIEKKGVQARVQTAIVMPQFAETFSKETAIHHLNKRRIVIFAAGTGNPLFTTDSAAALRTVEIDAKLLIKATNVNGIYDSDPNKNPNAKKFDVITYNECIDRQLKVMDLTAFVLCQENNVKIAVMNLHPQNNIIRFLNGEKIGTLVK